MFLSRPVFEDVAEVMKIFRLITAGKNIENIVSTTDFRRMAIQEVADREFKKGRFKNTDSAEKSIHDACSRRIGIHANDFDEALKQWLLGNNAILKSILIRHSGTTTIHREFIEQLLVNPETLSLTPYAVDIDSPLEAQRIKTETYRILRDTALARQVKQVYNCRCQICRLSLMIEENTPYAEAHHVKPLGAPHNGPDRLNNITCVCPNCHVLLDYGALLIDKSKLYLSDDHIISDEFIDYHNGNIFKKALEFKILGNVSSLI